MFSPFSDAKIYRFDPTTKRTWCIKWAHAQDIDHAIEKYSNKETVFGISRSVLLDDNIIFVDFDIKNVSSCFLNKFRSGIKKLQIFFENEHIAYRSTSGGYHFYIKTNIRKPNVESFKHFLKKQIIMNQAFLSSGEIIALLQSLDQVSTRFSSKQNIKLPKTKRDKKTINIHHRLKQIKNSFYLSKSFDTDTFPPNITKGDHAIEQALLLFAEGKSDQVSCSVWHSPNVILLMNFIKKETIFKEIQSWNTTEKNKKILFGALTLSLLNSLSLLNNFSYFKNNFEYKNQPDIHFRFLKGPTKKLINNGKVYSKFIKLLEEAFLKKFKGNSYQRMCDLYEIREGFFVNGNKKDNSCSNFIKICLCIIHDGYKTRLKFYGREKNDIISKDIPNKIRRLKYAINSSHQTKQISNEKNIRKYVALKLTNKKTKNSEAPHKYSNLFNSERMDKHLFKELTSSLSSMYIRELNINLNKMRLLFSFPDNEIHTSIIENQKQSVNNAPSAPQDVIFADSDFFAQIAINC